jgi:hypothetical protein
LSGKTSILKVVFHKMSANETLYLGMWLTCIGWYSNFSGQTNELMRDEINNSVFVQFHIWDVPGSCLISPSLPPVWPLGDLNLTDRLDGRATDAEKLFLDCTCLIYVIDARVCLGMKSWFSLVTGVVIFLAFASFLGRLSRQPIQVTWHCLSRLWSQSFDQI